MCKHMSTLGALAAIALAGLAQAEEMADGAAMTDEAMIASAMAAAPAKVGANAAIVAMGADGKRFVASPANDSVTTKDGWRLRYVSWQEVGQNVADNTPGALPQPRRIDAERNASAQADAVALRIVLDSATSAPAP